MGLDRLVPTREVNSFFKISIPNSSRMSDKEQVSLFVLTSDNVLGDLAIQAWLSSIVN